VIAIAAAYGALRIFLSPQAGLRLAVAALAFGLAVSGMHYTAMAGMHFVEPGSGHDMAGMGGGLLASPQILSLVVALLCFMIAAGFLLFLLPEQWGQTEPAAAIVPVGIPLLPTDDPHQGPAEKARRVPVQSAGATQFIDAAEIRSIRADAHYTWIHDGNREWMCSWSISEADAALDPAILLRVHRSYIVAMPHVTLIRKEGDGAVVELDGANPHLVPVSRSKVAEVRARLGLMRRSHGASR
jgi:hypothetical protein